MVSFFAPVRPGSEAEVIRMFFPAFHFLFHPTAAQRRPVRPRRPRRPKSPGRLGAALSLATAATLAGCPGPDGGARHRATPRPEAPAARQPPAPARTRRPAPRPASEQLTAEKTLRLASGATVKVPARWHVTRLAGQAAVTIEEPDRQLWIALTRVEAPDAKTAMAAAWKRLRPGFDLEPRKTVNPPPGDGWDAVSQTVYQTPTKARRVVLALARGKGPHFYVALVRGEIAAFGRRGAQLKTILASLEAPGVERESWAGKTANKLDAKRLAAFEAFVRKARGKLKVVGTAVAVIQDGRVIYQKGFGLRRQGRRARVTPQTLFMIGSITKSLTSMMMAKMVDEKRFAWSTPVTRVWPAFALGDPAATRRCTMAHTVCACTGLPRQDMEFLFEYADTSPRKRLRLLSTMKPTTGFGETFQYSNLLVAAGGYVAAQTAYRKLALGPAYRRAMRSRLFGPAGMRRTTFRTRRARRTDHAAPHAPTLKLTHTPIPYRYEDTVTSVGPAGGAWSNVQDMARFVLLELGRGKTPAGRRVVSAENLQKRWEPQVRVSDQVHYGLALIINRKRGVRMIGHGGGTLGFSTNMVFWPDHKVGLVSLTNVGGGSGGFNSLLVRRLQELLFSGEPRAEKALVFAVGRLAKKRAETAKRVDLTPEASWLKKHAGRYASPALGPITVRVVRGRGGQPVQGVLDAGEWKAPVARLTAPDGAVRLIIGPPLAGLTFEPGTADGKRTLTLRTAQQKYVFTEQ